MNGFQGRAHWVNAKEFQTAVLAWFDREGRKNLPWQAEATPYRVWVSEIMLQQTQVATVIPFFLRFIERFPDLKALALSPVDEVMGHWAGLGYYARARNLHSAAQTVLRDHAGELPDNLAALAGLPGIGRSTAGAILSLASGVREPILDGNVKRVLSRYAAIEGWPGDPKTARTLWRISEDLTPFDRVADYTQAMMDLGATLCTRNNPDCGRCPLQQGCAALRMGLVKELPTPRPKKNIPQRRSLMLVLHDGSGSFYMEKRPPSGIWGGLWSFPQFDCRDDADNWCQTRKIYTALESLPERRHTFSHYHLDYTPLVGRVAPSLGIAEAGSGWMKPVDISPFPAPVRRLMIELMEPSCT